MLHLRLSLAVVAAALLVAVAVPSIAQQGKSAPAKGAEQAPAIAPPKPYKPVAIEIAPPVNDPTFDAFRKQLGEIAKRKDKAGLAKLVAATFFWQTDGGDKADKKKTPGDNIAAALALDKSDAGGWDILVAQAEDPNASPSLERKGVLCAPAEPKLDPKELEALTKTTGTEPFEWAFPAQAGVEVRGAAQANAPVTEKLGMHLVRIILDDQPGSESGGTPMIKVVTPAGKVGFVSGDAIAPLGSDQVCYIKDAGGWKIAGVIGGEQQ